MISYLLRHLSRTGSRPSPARRRRFQLRLEELENRITPAFYRVTSIADTGSLTPTGGTGSEADPFLIASLRSAVEQANTNAGADTIRFASGLAGQTITLGSVLNLSETGEANKTTIEGLGADQLTISGNDATQLFYIDPNVHAELRAVMLTGGHEIDGGAIFNERGTLTVRDSVLSGNTASSNGGAIENYYGTLLVQNSTLSGNTAESGGGAIRNYYGTATIQNSTLSGNSTDSSGGAILNFNGTLLVQESTLSGNSSVSTGGGISSQQGMVTVEDSALTGNTSNSSGGAIFNDDGSLTVRDSTLSSNNASNPSVVVYGGAIHNRGGGSALIENCTITGNGSEDTYGGGAANAGAGSTLEILNSTVSGNTAEYGGGLYNKSAGMLTVRNSTISGNTATGGGGGLYNFATNSVMLVENCTISGNTAADHAGGVRNGSNANLTVRNSTISGNTAGANGGGIYLGHNATLTVENSTITGNMAAFGGGLYTRPTSAALNLDSTIVAQNTATNGTNDLDLNGGTVTVRRSLIGDNTGSGLDEAPVGAPDADNNLIGDPGGMGVIDPLLGPLTDNGGPTKTHALLPGSPALDAGFNYAMADFDQRGNPFVREFNGQVDIGGFELQPEASEDFTDDFNLPNGSGLPADYAQTHGTFIIQDGRAVAQGQQPAHALVQNLQLKDVVLEADIRLPRPGGMAGLVARYKPAAGGQSASFYWARLIRRNGKFHAEILRFANGKWKRLGETAVVKPGAKRLRFELVGNQLKLFVNGVQKVSVRDNGLAGPGQVGLRARHQATIDNFTITEAPLTPP